MIKTIIIPTACAIFMFLSCNVRPALKRQIEADTRLQVVVQKAESIIETGLNAGSGYGEVWIRDLNTFIEPACLVGDREKIREALLVFFRFQGADGNIVDGYSPREKETVNYNFIYSDLAIACINDDS